MSGRLAAIFLVGLGLAQMVGDVLDIAPLRQLAAATGASPAPKLFSPVEGFEEHSARFFLDWRDVNGVEHSRELTPEVHAGLRGPAPRRDAYRAIIARGPFLASKPETQRLFDEAARYALCGEAVMLHELGLVDPKPVERSLRLRVEPRSRSEIGWPLVVEVPCS